MQKYCRYITGIKGLRLLKGLKELKRLKEPVKVKVFVLRRESKTDDTVDGPERVGNLLIGLWLVQPLSIVYQVFELMGGFLWKIDFRTKTAILFFAHDDGILPVAVQPQYFNSFSQFGLEAELYLAIILGLVICFL
jgi:hypothetical protein